MSDSARLRLFEATAGPKYKCYVAAHDISEVNALAQEQTGVFFLKFKAKEITIPGYDLILRGENEIAGTNEVETGGVYSPEQSEPAAAAATEPERKPEKAANVASRAKEAPGRGQKQGRRGK
jgi:hypothetical protein